MPTPPPTFRPPDDQPKPGWIDDVFAGLIMLALVVTGCLLVLRWAGVI